MPDFSSYDTPNFPGSVAEYMDFVGSHDDATDRDSANPDECAGAHLRRIIAEIQAVQNYVIVGTGLEVTDNGGLDVAFSAGRIRVGTGAPVDVSASTLTVADDDTSYVECNSSGTVSDNTTGFTAGSLPLATVIAAGGDISSVTDDRTAYWLPDVADFITAGAFEIDGDKLDIDWNPSNYTPATTPAEASSVDNLTAHLYGIDQALLLLPDVVLNYSPANLKVPTANGAPIIVDTGTNGEIDSNAFDDTTEEFVEGNFQVPADLDTSGTVTFRSIGYAQTAVASKNIELTFYHSAKADGESWDAAYATKISGDLATDGTQDQLDVFAWTETVSNLGWAALDNVRWKIGRTAPSADNLSDDWNQVHFSIALPMTR